MPDQVAIYCRVSSEQQDLRGQERELEQETVRRGWGVAAVYREKVTGTGKAERPEYERLLSESRLAGRRWSHVLVWSLDRWSREERFTRAIDAILELEKGGISFHSLKEPYLDTPTEARGAFDVRGLLLSVTSLVAAFESRRRSERVQVAMDDRRSGRVPTRSGRPIGRPRRVTPELLAEIARLRLEGVEWSKIGMRLHVPAGSARKWHSAARRVRDTSAGQKPRVINDTPGFGPPTGGLASASPPDSDPFGAPPDRTESERH